MWTCPNCNRQFSNTNQDHSCIVVDLKLHLINKQQNVIDTFNKLKNKVLLFDDVRINSVKNVILFRSKSTFLAIKPKKAFIDIEFVMDKKVEGFPIYKTVQASKYKWAHFMRLESTEEVDDQLLSWIRKAYNVCK